MKKIFSILAAALLSAVTLLGITSCADAEGLHNQQALFVTFDFENFGDGISGSYSIPGNFNNWDNTDINVNMEKGCGVSDPIAITETNIQFSLVPVDSWNRNWYIKGSVEGNGSDVGVMRNFYIDGLDLNAGEITLVIDAISGTATPVVQ